MSDNKYKFSAKRIDNGEVIEGCLVSTGGYSFICEHQHVEFSTIAEGSKASLSAHNWVHVDPSTITHLFTTDNPDALIEAAYKEGHDDNTYISCTADEDWNNSDAKEGLMGGNDE